MKTENAIRSYGIILLALPLLVGLFGTLPAQRGLHAAQPPRPPQWVQQATVLDGRIYVVVKKELKKLG